MLALFYLSQTLFFVLIGFGVIFVLVRSRQEEREEDGGEDLSASRLLSPSHGLDGARLHENICLTNAMSLPLRMAIEQMPSSSGSMLELIAISARASAPIPFCFTIRRKKSTLLFDKLVTNTPIPPTRFEYELKPVSFDNDVVDGKYQCAANFPQQMRRMVLDGMEEILEKQLYAHSHRLEEISFTGTDVFLRILPAGAVDEEGAFVHAWHFAEPLALAIQRFVINTLHEPNAPSSQG